MKITTIGEVLIDMTEIGRDENGIPRFQANPGGAPANVAVAVSKLGGDAGFIGCVGEDAFGAFLRETLVRYGVDVHGLQIARDASTTLAVVTVDEKGERSFSFCRKPGADTRIDPDKAKKIASGADILHFGSVSLTDPVCRDTIVRVVEAAKRRNWQKRFRRITGNPFIISVMRCARERQPLRAPAGKHMNGQRIPVSSVICFPLPA